MLTNTLLLLVPFALLALFLFAGELPGRDRGWLTNLLARLRLGLTWRLQVVAMLLLSLPALGAEAAPAGGPTWLEPLLKYVVAPAVPILCALLMAALAKLVTFLHSRESQGKGAAALAVLGDLMQSVVATVEVDLRPQVQKALSDGVLSPEEGKQLRDAALARLKAAAPKQALDAAGKMLGSTGLETWLAGMVERANAAQPVAPSPR